MQQTTPIRWPVLAAMGFLACLVAAVFHRIGGYEFISLDVSEQVLRNPFVHGLGVENVRQIFDLTNPSSWRVTSYYPVRSLSFAIDYQIWGEHPAGFKLTNILLHLANVWLLFGLILRLFRCANEKEVVHGRWWDASAAAFGAGIFAVHPVVAEPVVWIGGREELLMVLGVLSCLHFHLAARRLAAEGAAAGKVIAAHVCEATACAFACLSNAVGAVIPLLVTVWDLLMLRPLRWRSIVSGTSALWLLGVATIVLKRLGGSASPHGSEYDMFSVERLMVILNVYWLNVQTLFWPSHLAVNYWKVAPKSFAEPAVILGAAALVVTCLILWLSLRHRWTLLGLWWFALGLVPTAQIIPHHLDRADRFLYLPLVGLAVTGAFCLRPLRQILRQRTPAVAVAVIGIVGLLLVSARTAAQVRTWRNNASVWQNCVNAEPANPFAHRCLADSLADEGRFAEARLHFTESLRINPSDPDTLAAFANRLAADPQLEFRDYPRAIELASEACRLTDHKVPSLNRTLAVAHMNYATALADGGYFELAVERYREAAKADPGFAEPLFNLASLLLKCPDPRFSRPDEALKLAEQACALLQDPNSRQWAFLGEAYAEVGRFEQAIESFEKAIRRAQSDGDLEMCNALRQAMQGYRDRLAPGDSRDGKE